MFSLLAAAALASIEPPLAQNQSLPPAAEPQPSDEVVVTGLRDLDDPSSAVTRRTLNSPRLGAGAVASRTTFEQSQLYAECALKRPSSSLSWLRGTLDGTINSARQNFAQEQFARLKATCAADPATARRLGKATLSGQYDPSYYDRGALFLEVLARFAPNLTLSRTETSDRSVQVRFNAREVPKARFRLPTDRRYFEVAICLVRTQPIYAVRLVSPDRSQSQIASLEAAMVNGSRECVGNAKHVYFDATQFRFYIADALYRWVVAARGVDTLIPVP